MVAGKRKHRRRSAEKLRGLERRVASLEKLAGKTHKLMCRAESAVQRATEAITTSEAAHLRVGGLDIIGAGQPMISLRANNFGGVIVVRNGSGQEVAAIGNDESGQGTVVVKDPAGLAVAGLQICAGRGELLTMSNQGEICQVSPGRPAKND